MIFRTPQAPPPQPPIMVRVLAERVAEHGDKVFAEYDDRGLGYRTLHQEAGRLAAALASRGVAGGDPVIALLGGGSQSLVLLFALAYLGALAVPVNPALKGESLAHVFEVTKARLAVIEAAYLDRVHEALAGWGDLEKVVVIGEGETVKMDGGVAAETYGDLLATTEFVEPVALSGGDPWAVMFTSGTTGVPKGAVLPHQQIASAARDAVRFFELDAASVFYTFHPQFHLNGLVFGPLAAIMAGARAVVRGTFPRERLLRDLKETGATHWVGAAYTLRGLMARPGRADDRDNSLRIVFTAGATVEEIVEFERRYDCRLMGTYGPTESGLVTKAAPARESNAGRLSDRHELRIVDAGGRDLLAGEVGEIWTRPLQPFEVMLGYYNMPEETAAAFSGDWFKTGDLGAVEANGNLRFVDRLKESLKRRGENISTFEVEKVLSSFPGVMAAAVVGCRPMPESEEEVRAFLELAPTVEAPDYPGLIAHCSKNLAYFMVPRFVDVVGELPRTALGKIEKQNLKARPLAKTTFDVKSSDIVVDR